MKYKNKKTGAIVQTNSYAQEFAYKNNSHWEEVKEEKTKEKKTAKEEKE